MEHLTACMNFLLGDGFFFHPCFTSLLIAPQFGSGVSNMLYPGHVYYSFSWVFQLTAANVVVHSINKLCASWTQSPT